GRLRGDLRLGACYRLVYTLMWTDPKGHACQPPHPGTSHGWTYGELRRFVAAVVAPATLALGVYAGDALSIGLILVCEGGMIRRVTTFEGLDKEMSTAGPTSQTLATLCTALDAQFAPPAAVLLRTEAAFSGWLAASDKPAYLLSARASGTAIWHRADAP